MPTELPLRCQCGTVRGRIVDAERVFRIVCMCRGCQAFAAHLGRKDEILDPHGGTDIYQLTPSQLRIDAGTDQLRSVRLTGKGAIRWFTDCCRTPVGNALEDAWIPWIGMPHLFIDGEQLGGTRDESGTPVRFRIHARHAIGDPPNAHRTGPPSLVFGSLYRTLIDTARGRQRPSPFRDPETGRFLREPLLATSADRIALGLEAPAPPATVNRRLRGCG